MRYRAILLCLLVGQLLAGDGNGRQQVRLEVERKTGTAAPEASLDPRRPFRLPPGLAAPGTGIPERLTVDDAVAIALWNNSAFEAALTAAGVASADLVEAGLIRNPNFQSLIPVGAKPFEFLLMWPIEDLWQRKKRVQAAQRNLDVITTGLVQNGLNLVRDVKTAHADLWLAERRAETLRESAALRTRIAELTERRRDAGDASGLDVNLAWADARSTGELAIRAEGDIEAVRGRLRQLIGLRDNPLPLSAIAADAWPALVEPNALIDSAYSSRPDLRAAELMIEASAYRAKWQRSRIFNLVMPMLSLKETGTPQALRVGPGLTLEVPLFNRNQGQIARADAEVLQAAWRYAALREQVEAEVRDAIARLNQARSSLQILRAELAPIVEQAIGQTDAAYRNGDASFLNVLESTRQKFDVILRQQDAEASFARAYAELERSVGKKL